MFELIIKNLGKIILSVSAILAVIFIAKYFKEIKKFLIEVKVELTKVAWSTRKELVSATWIVIITTGALGVFIGIVDFALSKLLSLMIK